MAAELVLGEQPRRRDRARRRPAAGCLADRQRRAGRHGRTVAAPAVAAVRLVRRCHRRSPRPALARRSSSISCVLPCSCVLAVTIVADAVNVPVVLVAMFALGTAETFADITTGTLMPMMVAKADLGVANARLTAGQITLNQLVGPPLGAFLFAAGMVWPSIAQAVACALAAVLDRSHHDRPPRTHDDGAGRCGARSPRGCGGCGSTLRSAR